MAGMGYASAFGGGLSSIWTPCAGVIVPAFVAHVAGVGKGTVNLYQGMRRLQLLIAGMVATLLAVAACSGGGAGTPTPPADRAGSAENIEALRQPPLVRGPVSRDGLQAILVTADLAVGSNRVAFLFTSSDGFVTAPTTQLSLRYLDGSTRGAVTTTATAAYRAWPFAERGAYTARLTFDRPGTWALDVRVTESNGVVKTAELAFPVAVRSSVPAPGSRAIASKTKTVRDVRSIADLTTGSLQDPDFYQATLAEAIASGRPTVFVLASPAFCTNEGCGPILETVQMLKEGHKEEANFVHADFFDNPGQLEGDLSNARKSPTAQEWGVTNTEWTFVIDRRGVVVHKFEGYATIEELEAALEEVL